MGIVSAFKVKFTNPGKIPEKFSKDKEDSTYKALIARDPVMTEKLFGDKNFKITACKYILFFIKKYLYIFYIL